MYKNSTDKIYKNSTAVGMMGEVAAIKAFIAHDYYIYRPFSPDSSSDIIVQKASNLKLYKIQCKTTEKVVDGVMRFVICRTNGFTGVRVPYTKEEIDYFCVYCIENNYIGLIPVAHVQNITGGAYSLRIRLPKNNQVNRVHMADDYKFDKMILDL